MVSFLPNRSATTFPHIHTKNPKRVYLTIALFSPPYSLNVDHLLA